MPSPVRLFTILLFAFLSLAQTPDVRQRETIAPGLERIEIKRGNFDEAGKDRWTIHVLVADPQRMRLKLGQAMDEVAGAEMTSSLALRHDALAAVNGGYFRTTGIARGEPMGTLTIAGKVLSEPSKGRAALAVGDDGKRVRTAMTLVGFNAHLTANGKTLPIQGFNRPREADELIVFTPEFHRTTLTTPDGVEAVVRRNRVTNISDHAGSQPIPHDGFVLSASGNAREWLLANAKRGARIVLNSELKTEPEIPFQPDFMLGAGPRLLVAGQPVAAAEATFYSESLFRLRHPRTAIGWRVDGTLLLVVVDGRQPAKSVGMTIEELTVLMRELGCVEAMNLDGGGSTTMVVKNKIINSVSDPTGERPVSDALLLLVR